jgi:hypothetical protein
MEADNKMNKIEKITFVDNEDTQVNFPGLKIFRGKINAIADGENRLVGIIFTLSKFSIWPEFQKKIRIYESIEWQYDNKIIMKITLDDIRMINVSYKAYTERQIIADIRFEYKIE